MESSAKVVFEDIFEVTALNPDGYKFDRVNRIQGMSGQKKNQGLQFWLFMIIMFVTWYSVLKNTVQL